MRLFTSVWPSNALFCELISKPFWCLTLHFCRIVYKNWVACAYGLLILQKQFIKRIAWSCFVYFEVVSKQYDDVLQDNDVGHWDEGQNVSNDVTLTARRDSQCARSALKAISDEIQNITKCFLYRIHISWYLIGNRVYSSVLSAPISQARYYYERRGWAWWDDRTYVVSNC